MPEQPIPSEDTEPEAAPDSSSLSDPGKAARDPEAEARRWATRIALLAALVFLPSLALGYVYDDLLLIVDNPYAHELRYVGRSFSSHLWDIYMFTDGEWVLRYYRPIVALSYIFNWEASGGAAWMFHLTNVVLHAVTVYLAVLIGRRWSGSLVVAVIAGLVLAIHPSRGENVIWIAGRTDLLMLCFALGSIELSHRSILSTSKPRRAGLLVAALLSGALACLSKEGGGLLPLLFGVDYLAARVPERARRRVTTAIAAAPPALYLMARLFIYPVKPPGVIPTPQYGLMTLYTYLERMVWPWPQTLYYRPVRYVEAQPQIPLWIVVAGLLVIAGLSAMMWRGWRRDRVALALLVTGLAFFGPLLNFFYSGIPVTVSDRFLYVPAWLIVLGASRLYRERVEELARLRALRLLAGGVAALWVGVILTRMPDYVDDDSFWQHELETNDSLPVVLRAAGRRAAREGDVDEAIRHLQASLAPRAAQFAMLANPHDRRGAELALVGLLAIRTPDGNQTRLDAFAAELDVISTGYPVEGRFPSGMTMTRTTYDILVPRVRPAVVTDQALILTRLGRAERARELVNSLGLADYRKAVSLPNLALVHARLDDRPGAARILRYIESPPPPHLPGSKAVLGAARQRFQRAYALRDQARGQATAAAVMLHARADLELGTYLQGARRLRPFYQANPDDTPLAQLYAMLLMATRLEDEARAVIARGAGADQASGVLAHLRGQLPPSVRAMAPLPGRFAHW